MRGDFTYSRRTNGLGYYDTVKWEVTFNGIAFTGEAHSIRQAYRHAKRAIRRYRKMWNILNPNEPRI